jgi:hypothetical protein
LFHRRCVKCELSLGTDELMTDQQRPVLSLKEFKLFVQRSVPPGSPLYRVVLAEKDELPVEAFLSKSEVWLELIDLLPGLRGSISRTEA